MKTRYHGVDRYVTARPGHQACDVVAIRLDDAQPIITGTLPGDVAVVLARVKRRIDHSRGDGYGETK